ncbi:MAG: hypothetical protein L6R39_006530 [Caloplaca ligustica]|nr:MAG: hypothetical protein L6R39_006530 [Caloplaca ligustica]
MAERLLPNKTPKASHGRGGAGNIGPTVNSASSGKNLITPTIKSTIYTTGRGGSGNMKKNDPKHPEVARKSQDVAPVLPRRGSEGTGHTGRGGAANILRPSIGDLMQASNESAVVEEGKEYERKRQGGDAQQQQGGDWWRDEMASGKEGRV